jgi:hypothetical protein
MKLATSLPAFHGFLTSSCLMDDSILLTY